MSRVADFIPPLEGQGHRIWFFRGALSLSLPCKARLGRVAGTNLWFTRDRRFKMPKSATADLGAGRVGSSLGEGAPPRRCAPPSPASGLFDSHISKSDSVSMGYARHPVEPSSNATIDPSDSDDSRFSFRQIATANQMCASDSPQAGEGFHPRPLLHCRMKNHPIKITVQRY